LRDEKNFYEICFACVDAGIAVGELQKPPQIAKNRYEI